MRNFMDGMYDDDIFIFNNSRGLSRRISRNPWPLRKQLASCDIHLNHRHGTMGE